MRFFTYGRKSVYRDNSDSIDNQLRMCREYCEMRFPGEIDSWQQFSDEDFTGANTNRPGFQEMMSLLREGACDVLVVYQLDRFSRDVRDFSEAYAEMQAHNVRFICLDLNIDTSTPIGEAMMYVSAAFGQMERKNIALRVADNMTGLAKKGYWVGGRPPIGYKGSRTIINGRKHVVLVPDPEGIEYINWLFDYFLSGSYSLQRLETEFKRKGIKTRNGTFFYSTQLHQLLTSPYGCEATPEVYDYFEAKGCRMESPRELWNGSRGIMVYGRTTERNKVHQKAKESDWTVCVGHHEPFMPAEKWLAVQARLSLNKRIHKQKYPLPLLRGVLRCSCGALMGVSTKKKVNGVSRWYYCEKRMRKGPKACSCSQIKCDLLDEKVLEVFRNIEADPELIQQYVEKSDKKDIDPKKIQAKINGIEEKIGRLTSSLTLAEGSSASKYIIKEMESLDSQLRDLKKEKSKAEADQKKKLCERKEMFEKSKEIFSFLKGLDGFSPEEKNEIVRSIVKECTWDGKTLFIVL